MVVLGEERTVSWAIILLVGEFLSRSGHVNQVGRESNIELEWASGLLGPEARSNLKLAGLQCLVLVHRLELLPVTLG